MGESKLRDCFLKCGVEGLGVVTDRSEERAIYTYV